MLVRLKSAKFPPSIYGSFLLYLRHAILPSLLLAAAPAVAQFDTSSYVPHRYLVLYRNATIPGDAEARVLSAGARLTQRNDHLGIAVVQTPLGQQDDGLTLRSLASQPNVVTVLHDRIVFAQSLRVQSIPLGNPDSTSNSQSSNPNHSIGRLPTHRPFRGPVLPLTPPPP